MFWHSSIIVCPFSMELIYGPKLLVLYFLRNINVLEKHYTTFDVAHNKCEVGNHIYRPCRVVKN